MSMDNLGDRMKLYYENRSQTELLRRTPVIIRLDGVAFHTLTKNMKDRFDAYLTDTMNMTTQILLRTVQNCVLAYWQSDEISLLLIDYAQLNTDAWFGYNVQKMVSVVASQCTAYFNRHVHENAYTINMALFDARAFNVPREDVNNYFVWRQKDAMRNSLNAYASMHFSAKELHGKNGADRQEMLHSKGLNWATDLTHWQRYGATYTRKGTIANHEFQANPGVVDECVYVDLHEE